MTVWARLGGGGDDCERCRVDCGVHVPQVGDLWASGTLWKKASCHMLCIAYQALSSTQPAYVNSMLTTARNARQLRSTSSNPLYIPRAKMKAGTRAFSVAAPKVWNSLPASVKSEGNIVSFRRCLKTYLFNAAYPP